MDIRVGLPKPENTDGTQIKQFLRQMELSIHHLQKAWEEIEKDAEANPEEYAEKWRDNFFLIYRFPSIDLYNRDQDDEGNVKVHVDEETDQMQEIAIEICQS